MANNRIVLLKIIDNPLRANNRKKGDMYTDALLAAADVLPKGQEKRALAYLANNPTAEIILDRGDKVVTRALHMAAELM